jgi:OTU domain-containing protein 3
MCNWPPVGTTRAHAEADDDRGDLTSPLTASPPLPGTPPAYNTPPLEPERPLTRRQRKALGLPKSRAAYMSAGRIIIPGGRYKKTPAPATAKAKAEEDEEWQRNEN